MTVDKFVYTLQTKWIRADYNMKNLHESLNSLLPNARNYCGGFQPFWSGNLSYFHYQFHAIMHEKYKNFIDFGIIIYFEVKQTIYGTISSTVSGTCKKKLLPLPIWHEDQQLHTLTLKNKILILYFIKAHHIEVLEMRSCSVEQQFHRTRPNHCARSCSVEQQFRRTRPNHCAIAAHGCGIIPQP